MHRQWPQKPNAEKQKIPIAFQYDAIRISRRKHRREVYTEKSEMAGVRGGFYSNRRNLQVKPKQTLRACSVLLSNVVLTISYDTTRPQSQEQPDC